MLRTLHGFLARELAKVTLLSLVAFTLVMTVFVIIEPLRKQGLSTDQVISFLGYTLPAMVSFTLPVAALFAATIVYGRFSQDNELLACRAGGIATLSLLEPALVLGVLVTAASLWLSNSVTPYLARRAEMAVRGDIRRLAYYQLRTQGTLRYGTADRSYVLRADEVDAAADTLRGVVVAVIRPARDPNSPRGPQDPAARPDVFLVAADRVRVDFHVLDEEAYASFRAEKWVISQSTEFNIEQMDQPPPLSFPLPERVKEDPSWYSWGELVEALRYPARNRTIERSLKALRDDLGSEMLAAEVMEAIRAGKPYTGLRGRAGRVELSAPRAQEDANLRHPLEAELLARYDANGSRLEPVVVRLTGERDVRILEADRCRVQAGTSLMRAGTVVSLEMEGDVRLRTLNLPAATGAPSSAPPTAPAEKNWIRREKARFGELEMPEELRKQTAEIDPNLMLANVPRMSRDPAVLRRFRAIVNSEIPRLQGRIQAEMHGRLAYGLSCFLMVATGAALGLLFRGGQLLSAFVLSMVPAAIVILLILSGKQMLGNPGVPRIHGLAAVWGGIAVLLAGDAALYTRLARK